MVAYLVVYLTVSFYLYIDHPDLHSFPTRRSSDLPDHAPRFKASVNFNGEIFESPAYSTTLRQAEGGGVGDRKSTRLNSSHQIISYAVFCLKKKTQPLS